MFLLKFIVSLLSRCSLKTLHRLGSFLGLFVYYISPGRRRVARRNLKIALGNDIKESMVKDSFKNSFKSFVELFYAKNIDEKFVKERVILPDLTDFFELLKQDRPIFLITGHIGSWEFLPSVYAHITKGKIAVVGKAMRSQKVDDIIYGLRRSENVSFITHSNAIVSIQRSFKKNIPVGALLDQGGLEKNCFFTDFFGHKTTFVNGIPIYAVRVDAVVFMAFLVRVEDKWKVEVYPPIYPDKNLEQMTAAENLARQINEVYEDIIKRYPEQWFALNKRFKRVLDEANGKVRSIY